MSKRARITLTPETDMEATEEEPEARPKRKPRARPGRKPRATTKQQAKVTPSDEKVQQDQDRQGLPVNDEMPETPPPGQWQTHTSPPPNSQADNGFSAAERQPGMLGSIIRTPAFGVAIRVAAAGLAVVSLVMLWKNRRL